MLAAGADSPWHGRGDATARVTRRTARCPPARARHEPAALAPLCARSRALSLHVGAPGCRQPRRAVGCSRGSVTDLGPRRDARPAADEAQHLQSKADPSCQRPAAAPAGSQQAQPCLGQAYGVRFFHHGLCPGSFCSSVPRKEWARRPGFTTGAFGVRLLSSIVFTALSARSPRFPSRLG